MTRAEKVGEAQRLRGEGLLLREIADRMGVSISAVNGWLSDPDLAKQRARRARYSRPCPGCGRPMDGSRGPRRLCAQCRRWTDGQIVEAIRRWADDHGGIPPTSLEWRACPGYPCADCVTKRLGWNRALLLAGFELRADRRPETQEEIERLVREGVPVREIAGRFGVTPQAIYVRFRQRGMSVRELREGAAA